MSNGVEQEPLHFELIYYVVSMYGQLEDMPAAQGCYPNSTWHAGRHAARMSCGRLSLLIVPVAALLDEADLARSEVHHMPPLRSGRNACLCCKQQRTCWCPFINLISSPRSSCCCWLVLYTYVYV